MKKILLLIFEVSASLTLFAVKAADFKPLNKAGFSKVVYSQDFESAKPAKGFVVPKSYQWKRGAGENGNGGLYLSRPDKNAKYEFARVNVKGLKAGWRYRLSCLVFATGITTNDKPFTGKIQLAGLDFMDPKTRKFLFSSYGSVQAKDGEVPWCTLNYEFTMPKDANATLCLFIRRKFQCQEVRWDNVTLTELGEEAPIIYPLSPLHLTLKDNDTLRMRAIHFNKRASLEQLLFAKLPDGRELSGKVKKGEAVIKIGKLAGQGGNIKFILCDIQSQSVLGEATYPFTFNPATPANAVSTDATGRVQVNGKPFFPVGFFLEVPYATQEQLDHMKSMGVNTILPYHNFEMRLPQKRGKSSLAQLRKSLDILHKNDLKICFCLTDLSGRNGSIDTFEGIKGRRPILKHVVSGLKDHPALLGWYVSDENPASELGPVQDSRFIISQLDPFHPVLTLTNQPENFTAFGPTGDVMMFDCYPVKDNTTQDMLKIRNGFAKERNECRLGMWWVPQIFNWGVHPGVFPLSYQQMRWPTEEEMRSHSLLSLNYRARGVIFYAYEDVRKHDKFVPGDAKKLWPIVERTVRMTADLEPWFLADKQPATLKVENKGKSKVEAKLHTANDGRKIIVITAMGPGASDAVITLPKGNWGGLKSRFGKTKMLDNGKYQFSGINAASDILE